MLTSEEYPAPECGVADANTGDNGQVTGGQANITGQADLSVATGSVHHEETMDAFALGLIFAVAIGGRCKRHCGERGQLGQRPHDGEHPRDR